MVVFFVVGCFFLLLLWLCGKMEENFTFIIKKRKKPSNLKVESLKLNLYVDPEI